MYKLSHEVDYPQKGRFFMVFLCGRTNNLYNYSGGQNKKFYQGSH